MGKALAGFILIGALLGVGALIHFNTMDEVRGVVVTEKERITTGYGENISSKYLIFTDGEVFENNDSLFALKWNSSDIYGRIKVGQTCDFTVTGWRLPFLSSYRNILTASCR